MGGASLLEMKGVSKSFPGVLAVNNVDFSVNKGEVVSLVGQNGAGKSTLVSLIGGIYTPDSGGIFIDGKKVNIWNPAASEELGIGMVHQEPTLVSSMTVTTNIFLNRELVRGGFVLDFKRMKIESENIISKLGFKINPNTLVEHLALHEREVVEIAKAMLLNPRILILDEVTAPLDEDKVEHLFNLICELKSQGMAIIFISHRLREIIKCSNRIIVIRDGDKVGELHSSDNPSEKDIIRLMLGDKHLADSTKSRSSSVSKTEGREKLLEVNGFSMKRFYNNFSFTLYNGEILGFAGLKGSGITEVFKSIYGLLKRDGGHLYRNGQKLSIRSAHDALENGIGMITNDRQKEGLALIRNITENITVSALSQFTNRVKFLNLKNMQKNAERQKRALEIKTPSLKQEVLFLSGGNQQKVVLAKWLLKGLDIILIDEPTRGVDVKAKSEIHKLLIELKNNGKGIVATSPEIPELLGICDRILVVASGEIVAEVRSESEDFNEAYILEAMHIGLKKHMAQ
jgi:ABC-type sugar transport system ATPase subunit